MSIQADIALNTSPFMKGLQDVKAATARMQTDVGKSAGKDGALGGLQLEEGKKGEKAFVGLAKDLLSARSAGEAFGNTMGRIGDIFKTGMAVGVITGLVSHLIAHFVSAREEAEKLRAKVKETMAANAATIDFGSVTQQLDAFKETQAVLDSMGKSGDGKDRTDMLMQQKALADAAQEQLALEAAIARLKAEGNDEDAQALELAERKRKELLQIQRSPMSEAQRGMATAAIEDKYGALDEAAELAKVRAEQLATEQKIATLNAEERRLIGDRVLLGETEEQRSARLVEEVGALVKEYTYLESRKGTLFELEQDALKIAEARNGAAQKMNELAKTAAAQQAKANQEEQALAKRRQDATPGIVQNAAALAVAATGNKTGIEEVDRRTRFARAAKQAEADGFSTADARRLAADQGRLEDLKRMQELAESRKESVGRADADRRMGLGGFVERGSDAASIARDGNRHLAEIRTILQDTQRILANQKPPVIKTGPAVVAP